MDRYRCSRGRCDGRIRGMQSMRDRVMRCDEVRDE